MALCIKGWVVIAEVSPIWILAYAAFASKHEHRMQTDIKECKVLDQLKGRVCFWFPQAAIALFVLFQTIRQLDCPPIVYFGRSHQGVAAKGSSTTSNKSAIRMGLRIQYVVAQLQPGFIVLQQYADNHFMVLFKGSTQLQNSQHARLPYELMVFNLKSQSGAQTAASSATLVQEHVCINILELLRNGYCQLLALVGQGLARSLWVHGRWAYQWIRSFTKGATYEGQTAVEDRIAEKNNGCSGGWWIWESTPKDQLALVMSLTRVADSRVPRLICAREV